ncbi:MAG: ABC transporter permease [Vicinamibacterales bacterium]
MGQPPPPSDPLQAVVERWRAEVRRVLDDAPPDLVDEVAEHLAAAWQAAVDGGLDPAAADDRTREELARWRAHGAGGRAGAAWRRLVAGWDGDVRLAWRTIGGRPAFALGIVGLTALAVAAVATTVAVAYGLLWRPLPYPDGHRLAVLWQVQQGEEGQVSLPDFRDLAAAPVFDGAAALAGGRGSLRVGDGVDRVNALDADPSAFALLGARPQAGRLLTDADRGQANVLISDRLWRGRFGAAPDMVGRSIWMSGQTCTVVGVLAPGVDFELPVAGVFYLERHDIWRAPEPPGAFAERRDVRMFEGLVRLAPGVTLAEAQAAVDTLAARLAGQFPATNGGRTFRVAPLRDEIVARLRPPLRLAGLAAGATAILALVNMIALVTVRLTGRHTELAVRYALGAGRLRVRRQIVTDHAWLVAAGAVLGTAVARAIVTRLLASEAAHLPRPDAVRFDAPVTAVVALLGLTVVLALSVLPHRRARLSEALRQGARVDGGARRTGRVIIAVQVGLALTLASGSALLGLSVVRLRSLDPGFAAPGVSTARVSAYAEDYDGRQDVERFVAAVLAGVETLPGVTAVAAGSSLPLSGQSTSTSVAVEGRPRPAAELPSAGWEFVTPGYFETLGIAVVDGRPFAAADRDRQPHVTVINRALADELFPGGRAVGRRIAVGGDQTDLHEIVGVVNDVRHQALADPPAPRVYDLFGQHWGRTLYVVARSDADAPLAPASLRRAVAAVDPRAPVFETATLTELASRSAAPHVLTAAVAAGLALAGLLLALAGVAAVSASSAASRHREMGVRAALGASPGDLFRMMLGESAVTVIAGTAAGTVGAFITGRLLASRAFGVADADLVTLVPLVAGLLAAAGVMAAVPAARAAATTDPLEAMRAE